MRMAGSALSPSTPTVISGPSINFSAITRPAVGVVVVQSVGTLPLVMVQKVRLIRVMFCLLENALEAAKSQHGRLGGRVDLRAHEENGVVVVEVADNGVGVAIENRERIFQQGFTTKTNSAVRYGLHNCANAITEIKGSLTMYSDGPGEGTCFTLTLPIA